MLKNKVDMHTHTDHSFDGNYPVDVLCESAAEKGIKTVAFTDHVEMDYYRQKAFDKSAEESFADIKRAQKKFKDIIEVCAGIELGEPTYNPEESEKLLDSRNYDFVIGSIHNLRNMPDFSELDYKCFDVDLLLKDYFNELKILASWGNFDTLAHLTYPLRYIVGEQKISVDLTLYKNEIDEILSLVIEKDNALEINTSGLRQKIGVTLPSADIIKRYKALGGRKITVGSDSHFKEHMGAGIEEGMLLAKECGFSSVLIFRNRKPVEIIIE